ncbi:MAG: aldehyde dehydrogenase family protein [Candidatus Hydrogenedentota bacterium]
MYINESQMQKIVEKVIERLKDAGEIIIDVNRGDGIFEDIESAITAAKNAQKTLLELSLEKRIEIIESMRKFARTQVHRFAVMGVEETGMGRVEDKIAKNLLAINKTPGVEDLIPWVCSGDHGLTLEEKAPFGVIGSITPSTNITETVIGNAICMIAAGNSVVFNPHPSAKRTAQAAMVVLNQAIIKAAGPANLITTVREPTLKSAETIFTHPEVKLVLVTGGPAVVEAAMKYPKRCICAGPGNPPVVVDETADIKKAAKDIILGATLDNNILCIAEKEIFVVEPVCDVLNSELKRAGGYQLSGYQMDQLMKHIVVKEEVVNRELVGRNANVIAKYIGLTIPQEVRLLFAEVSKEHPLIYLEQLMPVIPVVRIKNVEEGIELSLKAEHGYKHTAIMHSKNIERLSRMARIMDVSIFVKNGPSCAGLGYGGEGYTTFSIAGTTGEGLTTPKTFTRPRRCTLVDYFRIV